MNSNAPVSWFDLGAAVFGLLFVCWVFYLCQFGIEITDEGYHLVSIANPFQYPDTTSQFGLFYYPLYHFVGGDLVLFRVVNLFVILALSFLLFYRTFQVSLSNESRLRIGILSCCFSTSALLFLSVWQPTPSYNTLNAILLLALANCLQSLDFGRRTSLAWFLIGTIGGLLFTVKATTAGVAGLVVFAYLLLSKKLSYVGLSIAIFSALGLIIIVAVLMDGTVSGYMARVTNALENGRTLIGSRWISLDIIWRGALRINGQLAVMIVAFSIYIVVAALNYSSDVKLVKAVGGGMILAMFFLCVGVALEVFPNPITSVRETSRIFLFLVLPASAIVLAVINRLINQKNLRSLHSLPFILICTSLPYAFALGTYSNYFYVSAKVGVFFLFASVALMSRSSLGQFFFRQLLAISISTVVVVTLILEAAVSVPHRQPPGHLVYNDPSSRASSFFGGRLRLSKKTTKYFDMASNVARQNGFVSGDAMIDLTGASPGTLMAIGATSVGSAWMIGGYSGSDDLAIAMLGKESEEVIRSAWVLVEPKGFRQLDPLILKELGLSLERDYELVGEFIIPKGLGGRRTNAVQQLYRPKSTQW